MECYKGQGKLHRRYAFQILLEILQYFSNQPTLVDVTVPDGKIILNVFMKCFQRIKVKSFKSK